MQGYLRQHEGRRLLVALNMGAVPQTVTLPTSGSTSRPGCGGSDRVLLSTYLDRFGERINVRVGLRNGEGVIIDLETCPSIGG